MLLYQIYFCLTASCRFDSYPGPFCVMIARSLCLLGFFLGTWGSLHSPKTCRLGEPATQEMDDCCKNSVKVSRRKNPAFSLRQSDNIFVLCEYFSEKTSPIGKPRETQSYRSQLESQTKTGSWNP